MAKNSTRIDGVSLASKNLLASPIRITDREGERQIATVRPRRLRGGYDMTVESCRYIYERQTGSPCSGDVRQRGEKELKATVRPTQGNATKIDISGSTYIVYGSRGSFAIDIVLERSKRTVKTLRIGAARASTESKVKTSQESVPFTFDFKCDVPTLLVPLIVIIVRDAAARTVLSVSDHHDGTAPYLLSVPLVAVSAAFGGAVQ